MRESVVQKKQVIRSLYLLPTLLWYGVIWRFSTQTATQSSGVSGGLLHTLLSILSPTYGGATAEVQTFSVDTLSFCIRKAAHLSLYFVLTGLLLLALAQWVERTAVRRGAALALCAILAGLDEFHQTFVPGRSGEVWDVCIDTAGGAAFLLLWVLLVWLWNSSKTDRRPALLMGGAAALLAVCAGILPCALVGLGLPVIEGMGQAFVEEWSRLPPTTQLVLAQGTLPVAAQALRASLAGGAVCFALLAGMAALRRRGYGKKLT